MKFMITISSVLLQRNHHFLLVSPNHCHCQRSPFRS